MNVFPCAIIVTAAAKSGAEAVMAAYRGEPVEFTRALIPYDTPNPDPTTEPTHWLLYDNSTDQADIIVYQGFSVGDLPPLAEAENGAAWGLDGLPEGAVAMGYVSAANLQTYTPTGDVNPDEFVNGRPDGNGGRIGGILLSRGLMYRPDIY